MNELAIHGGAPIRENLLPIFKLNLGNDEFRAVQNVLISGGI